MSVCLTYTSDKSGVHLLLNGLPGKHCWSVNTSKLLLPSVSRSISETLDSLELDMLESILLVLMPCLLPESHRWKSAVCLHPSSLGWSRRAWYAVSERGNVRGSQDSTLCESDVERERIGAENLELVSYRTQYSFSPHPQGDFMLQFRPQALLSGAGC